MKKYFKYLILFFIFLVIFIPNCNAYKCKYTGNINEHKEWYELRKWFPKGYVELEVSENLIKITGGDADFILRGFKDPSGQDKWLNLTDSKIYKEAFKGKCQSKINICVVDGKMSNNRGKHPSIIFNDTLISNRSAGETDSEIEAVEIVPSDCIWYSYSEDGSDKPAVNITYSCDTYSSLETPLKENYKTYSNCMKNNKKGCGTAHQNYNQSKEKIKSYCNDVFANLSVNNSCSKSCLKLSDTIKDLESSDETKGDCWLSSDLINWIKNILKWIKYILPVLVIILGILDFIKAIASGSDDEMKKAQGRFIKRLIAAALLFLIPALIEFILNIFHIDSTFCGIL